MSRSFLVRAGLGVLVGALAVYAWQQMFPSEETKIRRQLEAIAADANEITDDLSGIAAAARSTMYFTEDVTIDPGGGTAPLRGREVILAVARNLQPKAGQTRVDIKNTDVTITPDGNSAAVTLAVTVTRDAGSSQETLDARELALTMIKRESVWLISHVTSVDTLR
jgi:hypothetical protein